MKLKKLNPDDANDIIALAEIMAACKDELLTDHCKDINLQVCQMEQSIRHNRSVCLLGMKDDQVVGGFWVDFDEDTGLFGAALLPEYRRPRVAIQFTRLFFDVCFKNLGLFKLETLIPIRNRPAERICRHLGMRKEGLLRKRHLVKGKRSDLLLLGLLADEWVNPNETAKKPLLCA